MNRITNDEIQTILNEQWEYINSLFEPRTVLGLFVIGPANFGNAAAADDITTRVITFPTIEDLAADCNMVGHVNLKEQIYVTSFLKIPNQLLNVKGNSAIAEIFFTPYYIVNPMYKKLFAEMQKHAVSDEIRYERSRDYAKNFTNYLADYVQGATQLLKRYFYFCDGAQEKFSKELTKTEEKALIYLLNTIGTEGTISISEAIKESSISRPVFTSLLDKLVRYKSAEVINMGVKGTYIQFYDNVLTTYGIY